MSADRLESEVGIDPLNRLSAKLRISMLGNRPPISAGIVPDSIFSCTSKSLSKDRLYRERGSMP